MRETTVKAGGKHYIPEVRTLYKNFSENPKILREETSFYITACRQRQGQTSGAYALPWSALCGISSSQVCESPVQASEQWDMHRSHCYHSVQFMRRDSCL
jgi:hypothetical protein